jgi:hypothetical protein
LSLDRLARAIRVPVDGFFHILRALKQNRV